MKSIFDLCVPRDEVLKGELREDIFAARLKDVMMARRIRCTKTPLPFLRILFPPLA